MASTEDTIDAIVEEIGAALAPLTDALESLGGFKRLMAGLGWRVDAFIGAVQDLQPLLMQTADNVAQSDAGTGDSANSLSELGQMVSAIRNLGSMSSAGLPATIDATEFKNEFPRQIVDFLLVEHLLQRRPAIGRLLQLAGVIRLVPTAATATRLAYVRRQVAWEDLSKLLSDPLPIFANAYHWGQSDFDGPQFLRVVTYVGQAYGLSTELGTMESAAQNAFSQGATVPLSPEEKEAIVRFQFIQNKHLDPSIEAGIGVVLLPEIASAKPGFAVVPYAHGTASVEFGVAPNVQGFINAEASVTGGIALTVRPDQVPKLEIGFFGGPTAASAKLTAGAAVSRQDEPLVLLGQGGGSRLEAQSISLGGGVRIQTGTTPKAFVEARTKGLALVIKPSPEDADGFLAKILPADMRAEIDLTAGIESQRGFYFEGSGLEIQLPVHIDLGPISIEGALIAIKPTAGVIAIDLATTIKADLSVLKGVVENVGIRLFLKTPPGGGKLGPFDLDLGFRPPNGVGLSIDAGVVKGGGYLYFDFDKGEYAGALELSISNWLSLKAIGLINTKMPGGQPGFSLLLIITAEFSPGFQLGYGFVLIGVGGLLGLNRAMLIDPMVQGVRTGSINSILFPTDIIANAPKIISDLRAIFPPHENIFLIGPMAKIGWTTLISVSLGVIIEIPGDVVILGRLAAILPDEEDAVLLLQLSFLGALEFTKRRVWFFATLDGSRILFITLDGEMGLLMDFSDHPNFVLSVGGFHPRFTPPPLPFPSPARIALSIVNESYARIHAETYFAITSNSVQMGVNAEAFFGYDSLSVEGHFGFDVLIRFSPFYLIAEISTGFAVKVGGLGVISIQLRGSLEGPTPWHITGSAKIEIPFFSISVSVDHTFGEPKEDVLPPIEVMPKLKAEFDKQESWSATLPASGQPLFVSLGNLESPNTLILHPVGTLKINQHFAPLNLQLDKIGNQKPSDVKKVTASVQSSGLTVKGTLRDTFAAAQYRDMDDAAKLSAPAYEPLDSGIELSAAGNPWLTGPSAQRNVRYETIILDTAFKRLRIGFFKFWDALFVHFRARASITRSPISLATEKRMQPFDSKIAVNGQQYTVASTTDNRAFGTTPTFSSFAEAQMYARQAVNADPSLTDAIHVIPTAEANLSV